MVQLTSVYLACTKPWLQPSAPYKLDIVLCVYVSPALRKWMQKDQKFKTTLGTQASLDYLKPGQKCVGDEEKKRRERRQEEDSLENGMK